MNITEQICSLQFAKRLKELGVKQDSLFYRFDHGDLQYIFCREYEQYSPHVNLNIDDGYSAFTSAELGELLPDCVYATSASGADKPIFFNKVDGLSSVAILNSNQTLIPRFIDKNEANSRAIMLIYLLENKLMELPE